MKNTDFHLDDYPYISKISIGSIFIIKELFNDDNYIMFADIFVYLNSVGIIYLILHSIYLRRMLVALNLDLD